MNVEFITAAEAKIITRTSQPVIEKELAHLKAGIINAAKKGKLEYDHYVDNQNSIEALLEIVNSYQHGLETRYKIKVIDDGYGGGQIKLSWADFTF